MKTSLHEILIAVSVALIPHIGNIPNWATYWCFALWGFGCAINEYFQFKPLPAPVRNIITLIGFAWIISTFGAYNVDMSVCLLVVMTGTKALEANDYRNRISLIYMGFFMLLTALFYSQTLLVTFYLISSVWLLTTVMLRQHDRAITFLSSGKFCGKLMLQATPLTLLIFFAFPRGLRKFMGFCWKIIKLQRI